MASIPIVDLTPISKIDATEEDWVTVANKFREALQRCGFVYIENHGIPQDSLKHAFEVSKTFFQLPQNVKKKYLSDATKHYHGYSHRQEINANDGSNYNVRESFDFAGTQRFYPGEISEFGPVSEAIEGHSKTLLKLLFKLLAKSLKIDDESYFIKASKYLDDSNVPSCSTFRTLFYPAVPETVNVTEGSTRTREHTDYGLITLLFQDMSGGLEVKAKDGTWLPQNPNKSSVLINTGDLLEFWTGGLIPATPHRVVLPDDASKRQHARQSIAYFVHPDDDTIICPIQSDYIKYTKLFEPVTAFEHAKRRLELV